MPIPGPGGGRKRALGSAELGRPRAAAVATPAASCVTAGVGLARRGEVAATSSGAGTSGRSPPGLPAVMDAAPSSVSPYDAAPDAGGIALRASLRSTSVSGRAGPLVAFAAAWLDVAYIGAAAAPDARCDSIRAVSTGTARWSLRPTAVPFGPLARGAVHASEPVRPETASGHPARPRMESGSARPSSKSQRLSMHLSLVLRGLQLRR
jgi:hypothetical protein